MEEDTTFMESFLDELVLLVVEFHNSLLEVTNTAMDKLRGFRGCSYTVEEMLEIPEYVCRGARMSESAPKVENAGPLHVKVPPRTSLGSLGSGGKCAVQHRKKLPQTRCEQRDKVSWTAATNVLSVVLGRQPERRVMIGTVSAIFGTSTTTIPSEKPMTHLS